MARQAFDHLPLHAGRQLDDAQAAVADTARLAAAVVFQDFRERGLGKSGTRQHEDATRLVGFGTLRQSLACTGGQRRQDGGSGGGGNGVELVVAGFKAAVLACGHA